MAATRDAFLEAFHAAAAVLRRPEVGAAWEGLSALRDFSLRGLAGHLVRAGARVLVYLDRPVPQGDPIPAAAYYVKVLRDMDDEGDHRRVRSDGEAAAATGWRGLVDEHARLKEALQERLAEEPPDRRLQVFGGHLMRLDDYLETRIVELLVHTDDLAASVGLQPPEPPTAAADIAIAHLVAVARLRHGDRAALIALTRRERDELGALQIF